MGAAARFRASGPCPLPARVSAALSFRMAGDGEGGRGFGAGAWKRTRSPDQGKRGPQAGKGRPAPPVHEGHRHLPQDLQETPQLLELRGSLRLTVHQPLWNYSVRYVLVPMELRSRRVVHVAVTSSPTLAWLKRRMGFSRRTRELRKVEELVVEEERRERHAAQAQYW